MKIIRRLPLRRRGAAFTLAIVDVLATMAGAGIGSGSAKLQAAAKLKPLVVGGMFPFTGTKSLLSQWGTHGVKVGIYEVNQAGGVLGHMLKSAYVDDAADSVDALPAFRKLELSHPVVIIGPISLPTI